MSGALERWWLLPDGVKRSLVEIQTKLYDSSRMSHEEQFDVARSLGLILAGMFEARVSADGAVTLIEDVAVTTGVAVAGSEPPPLAEPPLPGRPATTTRCSRCGSRATSALCPACASIQDSRRRASGRRK